MHLWSSCFCCRLKRSTSAPPTDNLTFYSAEKCHHTLITTLLTNIQEEAVSQLLFTDLLISLSEPLHRVSRPSASAAPRCLRDAVLPADVPGPQPGVQFTAMGTKDRLSSLKHTAPERSHTQFVAQPFTILQSVFKVS